jgi:hypothetical protein
MHDGIAGYVERGEVPGIVTLVSWRGEAHVDAIGMKAVGGSNERTRLAEHGGKKDEERGWSTRKGPVGRSRFAKPAKATTPGPFSLSNEEPRGT